MKTLTDYRHQWNEIIFQNRNKSYGAYEIRETYDVRIVRALFFSFAFITIVIITPLIISHYFSKAVVEIQRGPIIFDVSKVEFPASDVKQKVEKKQQNTLRQKDIAPVTASNDSLEDKKDADTIRAIPSSSNLTASVGTPNEGNDGSGTPNTNTGIPVSPPAVLSTWQVDKMPEFPGGTEAFYNFLRNHIRYPNTPKEIEGTVYISFVINAEGAVTNVKLLHGIGYGFDEEAMQVISKMPSWKPGLYKGESVSTAMQLPVKFVLLK